MRHSLMVACVAISLLCCSSPSSDSSTGDGGSAGVVAQQQSGSAGLGSMTGGNAGDSGMSGAGGAGGGSGGAAGDGNSAGGAGGGGAGGDGGAAPGATVPSEGCGKAGRPPAGEVMVPNDRIYDFPETYDGKTPMPLVLALHGANNPNTILQTLSNGSRLASKFVRAFPKSNTSAWQYQNGTGPDSQRITSIYNEALANYCIDKSRVFITGHSSGAQMSVQMMCATGGDKRFKAVAPVAASKYCNMLEPVPVLYIQGQMDAQRGGSNGKPVVDVFVASNMCMDSAMPSTDVPMCNSTFDQKPVNAGCVTYPGCSQPTIWCSHNDNGYNNTDGHQHGWPCFASNAIADFFSNLP